MAPCQPGRRFRHPAGRRSSGAARPAQRAARSTHRLGLIPSTSPARRGRWRARIRGWERHGSVLGRRRGWMEAGLGGLDVGGRLIRRFGAAGSARPGRAHRPAGCTPKRSDLGSKSRWRRWCRQGCKRLRASTAWRGPQFLQGGSPRHKSSDGRWRRVCRWPPSRRRWSLRSSARPDTWSNRRTRGRWVQLR